MVFHYTFSDDECEGESDKDDKVVREGSGTHAFITAYMVIVFVIYVCGWTYVVYGAYMTYTGRVLTK